MFTNRNVGKTLVNRSQGLKNSDDSLRGRVLELSLGDLNKDAEDQSFRKFKLKIDEIQGNNCLTNFYGMSFTSDKLRSMVRKWQTLIEAHIDVKTTDGYLLRMFCMGFTRRQAGQLKKTSYAQGSQVRQIRKKMFDIITKEVTACDLREVVAKLIPDSIAKEIEKQTRNIYPLKDVAIVKVKLLKAPKYDVSKLLELHTESAEETGTKVERTEGFVEPIPSENI